MKRVNLRDKIAAMECLKKLYSTESSNDEAEKFISIRGSGTKSTGKMDKHAASNKRTSCKAK